MGRGLDCGTFESSTELRRRISEPSKGYGVCAVAVAEADYAYLGSRNQRYFLPFIPLRLALRLAQGPQYCPCHRLVHGSRWGARHVW